MCSSDSLFPMNSNRDDPGTCSSYNGLNAKWIGPLFCFCCLIEAIIRAREAQALAIEMNALDNFEKQLSRAYSTTSVSMQSLGVFKVAPNADFAEIMARSTLRTWIPVASVLIFWLSLLPMRFEGMFNCGDDAALATWWIATAYTQFVVFSEIIQEYWWDVFWKWALPYGLHQPRRFYKRIRKLLRWIRYIRFAGPLARMAIKLGDQIWSLTKTWRQSLIAQTEKAKRLARPSLLINDIKKVESLAKVQTALATLPSQLFNYVQDEVAVIGTSLAQKQEEGQKIARKLQKLKLDVRSNLANYSDVYDRVVNLSQELKISVNNTLLSSHYLISPHSRFGVVWRITVTNCLLLHIFRLGVSWRMSKTFDITHKRVISRLLVECDRDEMKERFSFFTDRAEAIHKHLMDIFPLLPPPDDLSICVPSNTSSRLILQMAGALETFVSLVGFLDIFIWFFTGELDDKGVIVPKPFFSRCILPGTLVQILDHPTLPDILPALISQTMTAAKAAGWSRAIRWALAVCPAFAMLVIYPLQKYFFQPIDTNDGMMHLAEVCGVLASPTKSSSPSMHNLQSSGTRANLVETSSWNSPNSEDKEHCEDSILPSPRPLWGRAMIEPSTSFFNLDDSYSFDYKSLQY